MTPRQRYARSIGPLRVTAWARDPNPRWGLTLRSSGPLGWYGGLMTPFGALVFRLTRPGSLAFARHRSGSVGPAE